MAIKFKKIRNLGLIVVFNNLMNNPDVQVQKLSYKLILNLEKVLELCLDLLVIVFFLKLFKFNFLSIFYTVQHFFCSDTISHSGPPIIV